MKIIKHLTLSSCFSLLLCGCTVTNNNAPKYLKIGDTATTGKLSQTVIRLDYYKPAYSTSDENTSFFELEFKLHSAYDSIISLGGIYNYSVVFDGNPNNGGLSTSGANNSPESIAPNKDETVVLSMKCFNDWKIAKISFNDNNENNFSFSIKSNDYPDRLNNTYPNLKIGDSFIDNNGKAEIKLMAFATSYVGSAGVSDSCDNIAFNYSIKSLVSENIALSSSTYGYVLNCDGDYSSGNISFSTPNLPSSLPAHETISLNFIIVISKNWKQIVFGNSQNNNHLDYKFMLLHKNINY